MSVTMLRTLPRAGHSSLYLRHSLRNNVRPTKSSIQVCSAITQHQQSRRASSEHAISNPTLAGIEKRWEQMNPQEQADLWMALRDRMKIDWHQLTLQEKKAAYWIAFGPHGPRTLPPPGENLFILKWVFISVAAAGVLFWVTRSLARPAPRTMNAQYQELTNEYLKNQNTEPITGISSEGYAGKGMVQSAPRKGGIPEEDK